MDRRQFLVGLFGTAAVVAAGPLPKALLDLPKEDFTAAIQSAYTKAQLEIFMNDVGVYGFGTLEYLNEAPWIRVIPPNEFFKPMREESDRIAEETIARLKREFDAQT